MKQHLMVTRGLPGSGKSSAAKNLMKETPGVYKRVNRDLLRTMVDDGEWSHAREKVIVRTRDTLIKLYLSEGFSVIVDDTNLPEKTIRGLREIAQEHAVEMHVLDCRHVPLSTCIKQDLDRLESVGEQVIRRMWRDHIQPKPPVIAHDPSLQEAIICDLDGTLCHLNGRSPYDASTCEQDLVNIPVMTVLQTFSDTHHIIYTSGRSDEYRQQTVNWMMRHCAPAGDLHMRVAGDQTKDSIVKQGMYEDHIQGKFNVAFVLDDRNQVVDGWRALGLTVFQVAPGDF